MDIFDKAQLKAIGEALQQRQETVAVAESVTSGLLQFAFGSMENASTFYHGGITAYNLGHKTKYLSVDPIHAMGVNCVSEQVATEMATNVSKMFNSKWGIGITGYASPVAESGNKLFAHVAISHGHSIEGVFTMHTSEDRPGNIQQDYVKQVLQAFHAILNEVK